MLKLGTSCKTRLSWAVTVLADYKAENKYRARWATKFKVVIVARREG